MPMTYAEYLALDELLGAQKPLSGEHDELLFIVVHQVYELWFKQVLHELDHTQRALDEDRSPEAQAGLSRILRILKTLVSQLDVLETMTPLGFQSFRDRLSTASGFQSFQFRELELRLGLRGEQRLAAHAPGTPVRQRLQRAHDGACLYDAFLAYLARQGVELPSEVLDRDTRQPLPEHPAVRAALLDIYRNRPDLRFICERLVDLDEGLQEWRYRHVKMVERTIGTKMGTGGSAGAAYLRSTLFAPLFPDLWAIRGEF